jgi:Thioesterase-like superfamily
VASFYTRREDGLFVPTQATVGPWDPNLQHGSPLAALIATTVESTAKEPPDHPMRVAHFALDFFGPVNLEPLEVEATIARAGKKIELSTVRVKRGEKVLLRATVWRVDAAHEGAPPVHVEPPPPLPPKAATNLFPGVPRFGYGDALEWRFVSGGFAELGPATVWSRLLVGIVDEKPVSPVARVLAMVDSANGISAEVDLRKYLFVPVSLTVSLAREPEGEWMGMSARTMLGGGGGTTHATLFDTKGTLGEALQTLYVERR